MSDRRNTGNAHFLILGHRGCRNDFFEQNTMAAFHEALSTADGLETDACPSADNVVFLIHDTTYITHVEYTLEEHLDSASAARVAGRRLDQMHSSEIEMLRLKTGEPIPRLDRLLELGQQYPDALFNIELKENNSGMPVIDTLRHAIAAGHVRSEQILVSSFNYPELALFRRTAPEFKIGMLCSLETQSKNLLYPWSDNQDAFYVPFAKEHLTSPLMQKIAPDFIGLALETASIKNIGSIRAACPNARLIVWTLNEPTPEEAPFVLQTLSKLAEDGFLHSWITNEPRLRKAALNN